MQRKPKLVIIAGATATGKTALAVELARRLNSEIISCDSMQVYRHLTIGTAKPAPSDIQEIPYHLIDYVEPWEQYHVGRFLEDARPIIDELSTQGKLPIVCGGTGMYLRGLLHGVFDSPPPDSAIRASLESQLEAIGLSAMFDELVSIDPDCARYITRNDRQRILRALEVYKMTGVPISQLQSQTVDTTLCDAITVILQVERSALHERINSRTERMFANGLIDEVRAYLDAGFSTSNPAIQALGYKEIIGSLLEGIPDMAAAKETMKSRSRQYAKRQETWFRSMNNSIRIDVTHANLIATVDAVMASIEKHEWES